MLSSPGKTEQGSNGAPALVRNSLSALVCRHGREQVSRWLLDCDDVIHPALQEAVVNAASYFASSSEDEDPNNGSGGDDSIV